MESEWQDSGLGIKTLKLGCGESVWWWGERKLPGEDGGADAPSPHTVGFSKTHSALQSHWAPPEFPNAFYH